MNEELFSEEFFKQFKTSEELSSFLQNLQKRAIETMLKGELDAHLDYPKHDKPKDTNSRNGYGTK
ncbi:IS256 family transposase, partial [Empedobacter falsenii]|nr:IS256 family transposase [Empedobacter falsenii]